MTRYDRKYQLLAIGFATLAGFVDAIGFIESGGLFVSFMSGNSTRLAIGVADASMAAIAAMSLIGLFVAGVTLNVLLSGMAGARRKAVAASVVAVLLATAAMAQSGSRQVATVAMLCVAMGAANAVFQRDGEVSIGLTYMTGTLVKLGYRLADTVRGRGTSALLPYLALWLALVGGGVAGASLHHRLPHLSLWIGAAWSAGLALIISKVAAATGDHAARS